MTVSDPLDYRVLGPVNVRRGGVPVRLEGRKVRALLAILLIEAGRVVPMDRLVDLIWPDEVPGDPANTLHGYVFKLRRALEPVRGRRETSRMLVREGGGYRLDVPPLGTDAWRFEAWLDQARQLLAQGEPADSRSILSEALSLWRGPAYADVADERFAIAEVSRLGRLRQQARSLLVDAQLALGEVDAALAEVAALLVDDPLNERVRAQLMLTLYRSGRQADALAAFHEGRRLLSEGLGLDPDPATDRLYQAILVHDPALMANDGAAVAAVSVGLTVRERVAASLPLLYTTSFVGRADELAHVARLVDSARLVTIVGAPGVGKTRLAVETAAREVAGYADGASFIDLAGVADPSLVPTAMASALGIPEQPGRAISDSIADALADRHALIIVDNCEHLLEACAQLVGHLLRRCRTLTIIATSRQALGVAGEHVYALAPLALPAPGDGPEIAARPSSDGAAGRPSSEGAAGSDAIRLFIDRAAATPAAPIDAPALPDVARVCRAVDGIPLAIELAAAQLRSLTLTDLAESLARHPALLAAGDPGGPARHRTLWAAMDWSYDRLPPPEQDMLTRLSVFAGGFGMASALDVATADPTALAGSAAFVGLVDKSLITVERVGRAGRYRLLEPIRQYARTRLAAGEDSADVRRAHFDHFRDLALRADGAMRTPAIREWVLRLDLEHDNLRAALAWAQESGDAEGGLRLATALARYWDLRGHLREGRTWIAKVLASGAASAATRAAALMGSGLLAWGSNDYEHAEAVLDESIALAHDLERNELEALAHVRLGWSLRFRGVPRKAALHAAAARTIAADIDDAWILGQALMVLALTTRDEGDVRTADAMSAQAVVLFRAIADQRLLAAGLIACALPALDQGHVDAAGAMAREAMSLYLATGDRLFVLALETVARAASGRGDDVLAATLLGAASAFRESLGTPIPPSEAAAVLEAVSLARQRLGGDRFGDAWDRGRVMSPRDTAQALGGEAVEAIGRVGDDAH